MQTPFSHYIDTGVKELIDTKISYWGISDGIGALDGTTIVCADLTNQPTYQNHLVKIRWTGGAAGQTRRIVNDTIGGTIVVDSPFTDATGVAVPIVASWLFVIISDFDNEALYYSTGSTAAGALDGSTLIDTGLAAHFTIDDQPIGHTVRILTSTTATLIDQEREIYDYDFGTSRLVFATRFTDQVPIATTYEILRDRPSSAGGPIPPPEPATEETAWQLAWYDNFDVADATADTEKWSSEYISAGAADGTADIDTTEPGELFVDITSAAAAAAEYGVKALYPNVGNKWFFKSELDITVTNPNVNDVWAGLSISKGTIWDANNYIRIYKYQDSVPNEGIAIEYNINGAGAVTAVALVTTQDIIAFKIERIENVYRLFYSLTVAPHVHWELAGEVEDPTNSLTDQTTLYLSAYNPEDAAGQQITCNFNAFEFWYTMGNLSNILTSLGDISKVYDIVNAILTTSETGDTLTTTGAEQNMYINNAPFGVFKPLVLKLDTTNMIAASSILVKVYERLSATGGLVLQSSRQYDGVQVEFIKKIALEPNRHGIRTTITRLAGVDQSYDWEVFADM